MNMIGKVLLLSFIGLALSYRRANQYIDHVIHNALPLSLHTFRLDPCQLPEFRAMLGYKNEVAALFHQGNLTNLNRVHRIGDCSGPRSSGGAITINCTLRFTQLLTTYQVILRNGSFVYFTRGIGSMAETVASVVIEGRNYAGMVKSFKVNRIGVITPTFYPLPPELNKYFSVLQEVYKARVSPEVFHVIQNIFSLSLSHALSGVPMPHPRKWFG